MIGNSVFYEKVEAEMRAYLIALVKSKIVDNGVTSFSTSIMSVAGNIQVASGIEVWVKIEFSRVAASRLWILSQFDIIPRPDSDEVHTLIYPGERFLSFKGMQIPRGRMMEKPDQTIWQIKNAEDIMGLIELYDKVALKLHYLPIFS